ALIFLWSNRSPLCVRWQVPRPKESPPDRIREPHVPSHLSRHPFFNFNRWPPLRLATNRWPPPRLAMPATWQRPTTFLGLQDGLISDETRNVSNDVGKRFVLLGPSGHRLAIARRCDEIPQPPACVIDRNVEPHARL